jgi:hypothetical protein
VRERSFQQSSMRHLSRESSIAKNFLRQSFSYLSQSDVQKISHSSSKNSYIRQSEKKTMLKQSFKFRFSKFYQSSQLFEQFYRRSTRYSSSASSRSLISKSLISSSSFLSSVNQSIKSSSTEYDRELANLTKRYSDETKYSEKNDNFFFKLIMFNDMCD